MTRKLINQKPEIVVVAIRHIIESTPETLEGLKKAGVDKRTLVLVESNEKQIKNLSNANNWMKPLSAFLASKKARVSSFEPENVSHFRSQYDLLSILKSRMLSESLGSNFGAEDIMSDVIEQKARGQKKVVVVTGAIHATRIPELLHAKGFKVKVINTAPSSFETEPIAMYTIQKREALLRGYGGYLRNEEMKEIKPTQINRMNEARNEIRGLKWRMPTTFRFNKKGKLIPVRTKKNKNRRWHTI